MNVRIGYTAGAPPLGVPGIDYLRRLVEVGESHKYDSIWLSDRIVGGRFPLEPVVALSMVAALSPTLKFGPSVLAVPLRNPVLLAKELATLDYLSNGRLLPAVGLGNDMLEYAALGVSPEDRGARADEAISLMRTLWREDEVTFDGRFFKVEGVRIVPRPVQQPSPPIWIGGRTKAAQRRVGRVGDGWLVSQATPAEVEQGIEVIATTAAQHDRQVDGDHVGAMIGFHLADSLNDAATNAEPFLIGRRVDVAPADYIACGPPDAVVETIGRYVAAGASKFVVRPLCLPEEVIDQLERFGREVLPRFHG
jgi:probable F420-dependent oxidoreductase